MNSDDFVFTLSKVIPNARISIFSKADSADGCTIDWGDGGGLEIMGARQQSRVLSHIYSKPGDYTVSVSNAVTELKIINYGGYECIGHTIDVKQWGTAVWRSMQYMFSRHKNMTVSATDVPDLSRGASVHCAFFRCTNFNSPINHWDVDSITGAYAMLFEVDHYTRDLSNWDRVARAKQATSWVKDNSNGQSKREWDQNYRLFGDNKSLSDYCERYNAKHEREIMLNVMTDSPGAL